MAFFNKRIDKTAISTLENIIESDFTHLNYTEAVEILEKHNQRFEFPVKWGSDLQSEHERFLTENQFKGPVIVTDYPAEIKAFYMKLNPNGKTVRAMDVLLPKVGEIIGGSQREDDYDKILERLAHHNLAREPFEWYLDLRRYGSVPHSGFGLGIERTVAWICGLKHLREAIPFPRLLQRIYP